MPPYKRRARRRFVVQRPMRLLLSALVLILLVVCVILLVRGCTRPQADQTAFAPQTTAAPDPITPEPQPDAQTAPPDAQSAGYNDAGDEEDLALQNVADESVDLAADLNAANEPTVPAGDRVAVIRAMGDIVAHVPLLKTAYDKTEKTYDFSPYFSEVAASMGKADYSVINVDGPLGGKKFASYRGYPQFNTPPQLLLALKNAGIDMLTLANNHALDTYLDGLIGTIDNVDKAGLAHVGAYRSQAEYDTPMVVSINGIRVGFLAYTTGTNGLERVADKAATTYGIRYTSNSNAPKDIEALRGAGAEVVVVFMHWGEEYVREVSPTLQKMAKTLVAAGADVVIGGHPHVVMPCQWVSAADASGAQRTGLVLYSMGNFLSDQRSRYRDSGIIFEFTLQDNPETGKVEVVSPRYIPVYVHRTKLSSSFDYRVMLCAKIIADPPANMGQDVVKRVKQVWNELKAVMEGGPAEVAKS